MNGLATIGMSKKSRNKDLDMLGRKVAEIVSIMMADRTYAHLAHLKTSSYSTHIALNEFYDADEEEDMDVTSLMDSLAEVAQGKCGKLDIPVGQVGTDLMDPAGHLEKSLDKICELAEGCKGRALNAIVDQIEELYLGTIYKIRELH